MKTLEASRGEERQDEKSRAEKTGGVKRRLEVMLVGFVKGGQVTALALWQLTIGLLFRYRDRKK